MNRKELYNYILNNYTIDGITARIIDDILFYIESRFETPNDQRIAARDLLQELDIEPEILNNLHF